MTALQAALLTAVTQSVTLQSQHILQMSTYTENETTEGEFRRTMMYFNYSNIMLKQNIQDQHTMCTWFDSLVFLRLQMSIKCLKQIF